jgi:hypothetical protein
LLEAAQRLVAQGLAHYESGTWLIASSPEALSAAIEDTRDLERRVCGLSEDAVELLGVVAFDRHLVMDLASYPALLKHADSARMHHALSELVDARWVELYEERVRMVHEDRRGAVLARFSEARHRELHACLAERCVDLRLPAVYEAHHRLGAGDKAGAVAALDRFETFVEQHPTAEILRHPITLETTEAVAHLQGVPGAHPAMAAKYLSAMVLNATYRTLAELTAVCLPGAFAALAPFSGTQDYAALSDLAPSERLTQALTRASERCSQPGLGAMDVVSALRRQTQIGVAAAVIANFMSEARIAEAVPDLTPFRVLSPALDGAAQVIDALSKLARGQTWLAWDALIEAQRYLRDPAATQLDALTRMLLDRVVSGYVCELNADFGTNTALALIDEYAVQMPDLAASHRTRYCLAQGNLSAAAEARRRFEVLSVRTGALANARIIELPAHLTVYTLCGDVIGLRRTHRMLQEVARTRPGWQTRVDFAQAQLLRWRGELDAGLSRLEALLGQTPPPHPDWQLAAASKLGMMIVAKRSKEAVGLGSDYLARARDANLPDYLLRCMLAQACLDIEDGAQAEQHFGRAVEQLEQRGAQGVLPGCAYEVGARIAGARGDADLFQTRADICGMHFRLGKHPALTARYNALRRTGMLRERMAEHGGAVQTVTVNAFGDTVLASLRQLASKALDDASFYRGLLDVVLDNAGAVGGILYVKQDGGLQRVAFAGDVATLPDLDLDIARRFALGHPEEQDDQDETASVTDTQSFTQPPVGAAIGKYALECSEAGERSLAGALVLEFATLQRPQLSTQWLTGVAAVIADWAGARASFAGDSQSRASTQTTGSRSVEPVCCDADSVTKRTV